MIPIIFRAKDKNTGEWVEGNYCCAEKLIGEGHEHFIIEIQAKGSTHQVLQETVGQFTGLRDMNGVRAFEGDITEDGRGRRWVIFRAPGGFGTCRTAEYAHGNSLNFYEELGGLQNNAWFMQNHKIVGNIHENDLKEGQHHE